MIPKFRPRTPVLTTSTQLRRTQCTTEVTAGERFYNATHSETSVCDRFSMCPPVRHTACHRFAVHEKGMVEDHGMG